MPNHLDLKIAIADLPEVQLALEQAWEEVKKARDSLREQLAIFDHERTHQTRNPRCTTPFTCYGECEHGRSADNCPDCRNWDPLTGDEDYLAARRTGTLKLTAEDAALEVFARDLDTAQRIPARLGLLASIVYVAPAI